MNIFEHIILNGRPGGGKSELIDFIKQSPLGERQERYHIGDIVEMDDFVWLWEKFIEDDLWEKIGKPRLYSRKVPHGYVQLEGDGLLDMLVQRFNHSIQRDFLSKPDFYQEHTLFVEFARGVVDGGLKHAYDIFDTALLQRSVILYISVSFEESQRRNEARYQEALAHSILAHRLPEESIQRFSAEQDWESITEGRSHGYLDVKGVKIPFVTMNNEPQLKEEDALQTRYTNAMQTLWELQTSR